MSLFKYACQGLVLDLGGRCRNIWDAQAGDKVCALHRRTGYELVGLKMWTLLRFTLNEELLEEAHDAGGIPFWQDAVHPVARQAWRQREAEELGRKFAAYRPKGDTGSLIFQPCLPMVDISDFREELEADGYALARMDIKPVMKDDEVVGGKFTMAYVLKDALESAPCELTENQASWLDRRIFRTPWGKSYQYDNPHNPGKDPTNTMNFTNPAFGQKPRTKLHHVRGLLDAEILKAA